MCSFCGGGARCVASCRASREAVRDAGPLPSLFAAAPRDETQVRGDGGGGSASIEAGPRVPASPPTPAPPASFPTPAAIRIGPRTAAMAQWGRDLTPRKVSGVSSWRAIKRNAWARARGGSTTRWTMMQRYREKPDVRVKERENGSMESQRYLLLERAADQRCFSLDELWERILFEGFRSCFCAINIPSHTPEQWTTVCVNISLKYIFSVTGSAFKKQQAMKIT
ncbi:uncharacterized protein LOC144599755 [Rhinoraja longicauda]